MRCACIVTVKNQHILLKTTYVKAQLETKWIHVLKRTQWNMFHHFPYTLFPISVATVPDRHLHPVGFAGNSLKAYSSGRAAHDKNSSMMDLWKCIERKNNHFKPHFFQHFILVETVFRIALINWCIWKIIHIIYSLKYYVIHKLFSIAFWTHWKRVHGLIIC